MLISTIMNWKWTSESEKYPIVLIKMLSLKVMTLFSNLNFEVSDEFKAYLKQTKNKIENEIHYKMLPLSQSTDLTSSVIVRP